jgi:hypothetical protein
VPCDEVIGGLFAAVEVNPRVIFIHDFTRLDDIVAAEVYR